MSLRPLVSCICVTENRPAFMPWLLWNFDKQSWQSRELIIVDSSDRPFDVTGRDDVIVIPVPHGMNIPIKRNLGLHQSSGTIITWFDDDDWQHPDKLTLLVDALSDGAPYAGSRRGWFVNLSTMRCEPFRAQPRKMVFNSAGFRRDAAMAFPFDEELWKASDEAWMEELSAKHGQERIELECTMFFWLCHERNISNPISRRRFSKKIIVLEEEIGREAWEDTTDKLEALNERRGM